MTRKEKHLSVLSMYLAKLEQKYENDFNKLSDSYAQGIDQMRELVNLYHKIEEITKEIEQINRGY